MNLNYINIEHQNIVEEVYEQIKGFSNKQAMFFSYLCSIRALPFLCDKRKFSYWESGQRENHLYAILNAVEISALRNKLFSEFTKLEFEMIYERYIGDNIDTQFAYFKAYIAANDAYINAPDAAYAAHAAANAVITAFFSDSAAYIPDFSAPYDASAAPTASADNSIAVSIYAAANAACSAGVNKLEDIKKIIFSDINAIKKNRIDELNNDISIYGDIWFNFLDDLTEIGFSYWADGYSKLFVNNFEFDKDELILRLSVPKGIRSQGGKAISSYITNSKKQGVDYVAKETRLILIGSASAGKTTLARRLNNDNSYPAPGDSTHGVDISINLDFKGVQTHLWDFGGQIIYHSSHKCFMSEGCVYILVVNGRDEAARDTARIEYWLDTIRVYSNNGNGSKVFIVVNESDNRKQNIDKESLKNGEYGSLIEDVFSFNVGNDFRAMNIFRERIAKYIASRGFQLIGANDKKVMNELKVLFDKGTHVIESDKLNRILKKSDIREDSDTDRVISLLNTLGVALHYDCISDYVLDPSWISRGVYKVIDYMQSNNLTLIYEKDFQTAFADEQNDYNKERSKHIYLLMIKHKIAFENKQGLKGLLVPCVASQRKPSGLVVTPDDDNLVTKTTREGLKEFPADFFERYIYENHEDIVNDGTTFSFWLTGMVLVGHNSSAYIEIIENREIVLTVWGKDKEQYEDMLYKRLDNLLKDYSFIGIGAPIEDVFGNRNTKIDIFSDSDKRFRKTRREAGQAIQEASKILEALDKSGNIFKKYLPYFRIAANTAKVFFDNIFFHQ